MVLKELLSPRLFPRAAGSQHTRPCVLVPRQSSLCSPARDQLCKHFALPDQITWPKVSHMMGLRKNEKPELLWFHLSEVKRLNQQHFLLFWNLGTCVFWSSLWKNAGGLFFTEMSWEQKKNWHQNKIINIESINVWYGWRSRERSNWKCHAVIFWLSPEESPKAEHPVPPANRKASLNAHSRLQAKQNRAADFVNVHLVWCNYHIILQGTIKNMSRRSFVFPAVQLKSQ